MSTRIALFVLLSACAAKPLAPAKPPPTERSAVEMRARAAHMKPISREPTLPPPPKPRLELRINKVPRPPGLDPEAFLPDTAYILRWPLMPSMHPELAPQFPIAATLAEGSMDWIGLCRRGAHLRHAGASLRDPIAYLGAWCAVGDNNIDVALTGFAALARSPVGGLAVAVRQDIANVLVQHGDADDALRLLSKHRIRDLEIFDRLAATYLDIGKPEDARDINQLTIARDDPNRANRCRRQARRVVMDPEPYRPDVNIGRLLFDEPAGADRTCTQLEVELACWLRPRKDCAAYFKAVHIAPDTTYLLEAFELWPIYQVSGRYWMAVATNAIAAGTIPHAYDYAVVALEQAAASTDCDASLGRMIRQNARALLDAADRPKQFDARLVVFGNDPDLCD